MLVFFAFAAMTSAACPTVAKSPSIYWADNAEGTIRRADLDGSNEEVVVAPPVGPEGIAVDTATGKVYWIENGAIRRAGPDGSNPEDVLAGIPDAWRLAIDSVAEKIYWVEVPFNEWARIRRADLSGSNAEDVLAFIGSGNSEVDLAFDSVNRKLYWSDRQQIQRANPDGSDIETVVGLAGCEVPALAIDSTGQRIYWISGCASAIKRANLDGSNVENVIGDLGYVADLTLDVTGGWLYWTEVWTHRVRRMPLNGGDATTLITEGLTMPLEIAVDPVAGKLYIHDDRSLRRAGQSGAGLTLIYHVEGATLPQAIALDTVHDQLYWTDTKFRFIPGRILRAGLDGKNPVLLVSGLQDPTGLALDVDAGKMYWADAAMRMIARANLNGSEIEALLTDVDAADIEIDPDNGKLYWIGGGGIWRANLDGSSPRLLWIDDIVTTYGYGFGIDLDLLAGKMYFLHPSAEGISRANLDGSDREIVLQPVYPGLYALAIDAEAGQVYWSQGNNYQGCSLYRICGEGVNFEHIAGTAIGIITGIALDLRRTEPPGDGCALDLRDFARFQNCFWPLPDAYGPVRAQPCATFDFNGDGQTIDLTEFNRFLDFLAGP